MCDALISRYVRCTRLGIGAGRPAALTMEASYARGNRAGSPKSPPSRFLIGRCGLIELRDALLARVSFLGGIPWPLPQVGFIDLLGCEIEAFDAVSKQP